VILPIGIFLVGLAVFAILRATRPDPPKMPAHLAQPLVRLYEVPEGAPTIEVTGYGTVRAKRKISLVPQVSGIVVEKSPLFEPGEFFDEGTRLLSIDDTDYRLAAERAAAEVARAEYNLALAEEEAAVAEREWEQIQTDGSRNDGNLPNPLVLREPQLNLARAELAAARASRTRAEVDLARCTVTAPFDGRVLESDLDAGQYVRAGNPVGTIYATDLAEVTVPLPDADLSWIRVHQHRPDGNPTPSHSPGSPVDISADFAGQQHHWSGYVARLSGAVDRQSRMVHVIVEIPDPYHQSGDRPPLIEGMFVEARISGISLPEGVTIPRAALREGNKVWVVDDEGVLEIRPVSVARAGIEEAIITANLEPGEKICLSNLQVVSNGMRVRPLPAEPPAETPGDPVADRGRTP
jgi:RND family efflux transporter MFP subunit